MRAPLAPHKDQDGFVYVRVRREGDLYRHTETPDGNPFGAVLDIMRRFVYRDTQPQQRVISSRRVEEDVETGDYLKRCLDEDLDVRCWSAVGATGYMHNVTGAWWIVWKPSHKKAMPSGSPTLREAYWRYKNAAG